ncbi:hypothetical protein EYF80_017763 [Liparis tanakae]|uniref:Uncharacterized protein n=1 Tax=Liparis tanakae TaxID=230148 RepID=A0A4Z2I3B9_9TELE|nr:hypothetical protein EYF80_017763 [Liparis tanakae]
MEREREREFGKWMNRCVRESDSSSAGVVQLKLKERKEGGMWERRGGREGGESLASLCIFSRRRRGVPYFRKNKSAPSVTTTSTSRRRGITTATGPAPPCDSSTSMMITSSSRPFLGSSPSQPIQSLSTDLG